MRQQDIEAGYIYYGKTGPYREVVELFDDAHGERCVKWRRPGEVQVHGMFLRSFARWADRGLWAAGSASRLRDTQRGEP